LVLTAARAVFLEHGYHRTSMDMVAHEAGVSKATVYAHFESKQQLLIKLVEDECEAASPPISPLRSGPIEDIEAVLIALARNFTNVFINKAGLEFYRLIISNVAEFPELASSFIKAGPDRHQAEMAEVFGQAMQQGVLEIDDMHLAVKQFIGLVAADLPLNWSLSMEPPSAEQYEALIKGGVRVFLRSYGVKRASATRPAPIGPLADDANDAET